ncbi:MAG: hypothetical protein WDA18_00015 [Candidatus Ratteibacteria bacterium]
MDAYSVVQEVDTFSIEESVLVNGATLQFIKSESPSIPAVIKMERYIGGVDSGLVGDDIAFQLASPKDKRWGGGTLNPEAIELSFSLAPDADIIEVEVGYYEAVEQTRRFDIILDNEIIHTVELPKGQYGSKDNRLKQIRLRVKIDRRDNLHILKIRQFDSWGVTHIDAIKIRGKGIHLKISDIKEPALQEVEKKEQEKNFLSNKGEVLSTTIEESVIVNSDISMFVRAQNPSIPRILKGRAQYEGGIDSGLMGDKDAFRLASPKDKRWEGGTLNPEAIEFSFSLAPDAKIVEVEVGYYEEPEQTRRFDIILDNEIIQKVEFPRGQYGSKDNRLKQILIKRAVSTLATHTLRIQQVDNWGITTIDAVKIRGKGVKLIDPQTNKPVSRDEIISIRGAGVSRLPENFLLPKGSIAIDFGTATSPVWSEGGFIRVTPETIYKKDSSLGWVDPHKVLKGVEDSAINDLLRRDYVTANFDTHKTLELRLKIEPGRYRAFFIISGGPDDWSRRKSFMMQFDEKQFRIPGLWTRTDSIIGKVGIIHREVEFVAEKEELTISFPEGYMVMNALIIYPAPNNSPAPDPEIFRLIEEYYLPYGIEVRWPGLEKTLVSSPNWEPKDTDIAKGFTFFCHPWDRYIVPYTLPLGFKEEEKIDSFTALGEFEPFAFSIRTHKELKDIHLQFSGFERDAKSVSGFECTLYEVSYQKTSLTIEPSNYYSILPKFLFPVAESISLPANFTKTYWIIIKVPDTALPGLYYGSINIKAENTILDSIPVSLEILPFKLNPLKDRSVGMYWHHDNWILNDKEGWEIQFSDMAEHGVNATTAYEDKALFSIEAGELKVDFSKTRMIMEMRKRYGITGPIPNDIGDAKVIEKLGFKIGTPEFEKHYLRVIELLVEEINKNDWPEYLLYVFDEPSQKQLIETVSYVSKLARRVPQAPQIYATTLPDRVNYARRHDPEIDKWLNVRCYHADIDGSDIEEIVKGTRFFFYGGHIGYTELPNSALQPRYTNGFFFWRTGAEAMYYWVYAWPYGNQFFSLDSYTRECGFVECGPAGEVVPTIMWEGVRQGINDLKYITLLEEVLVKLKDGNLKKKGLAILEEIKEEIPLGNRREKLRELESDSGALNKIRKKIAYYLKEVFAEKGI